MSCMNSFQRPRAYDPAGERLEAAHSSGRYLGALVGVSNSIPMKDREDHPFWLEIFTEEQFLQAIASAWVPTGRCMRESRASAR